MTNQPECSGGHLEGEEDEKMLRSSSTEAFVNQERRRLEPKTSITASDLLDSHRLIKTGCIIFLPLAITLVTVATSLRYMHTPGNQALFPASSTPSRDERRLAEDGAEVTYWPWRWPSGTPGGGRTATLTTEQIENTSLAIDSKEPTLVSYSKAPVTARAADEFRLAGTSVTPPKAQFARDANLDALGQPNGDRHDSASPAPFHFDRNRGNNDSENVKATSDAPQGRVTKGRPYAPFIRNRETQPLPPYALAPFSERATRNAERGWPSLGYASTHRTSASSRGYRSKTARNGSTSLRHRRRHGDAIRKAPPRLPVYTPERLFKRETTRPPFESEHLTGEDYASDTGVIEPHLETDVQSTSSLYSSAVSHTRSRLWWKVHGAEGTTTAGVPHYATTLSRLRFSARPNPRRREHTVRVIQYRHHEAAGKTHTRLSLRPSKASCGLRATCSVSYERGIYLPQFEAQQKKNTDEEQSRRDRR